MVRVEDAQELRRATTATSHTNQGGRRRGEAAGREGCRCGSTGEGWAPIRFVNIVDVD